jgi:hypothetical protein
MVITGFALMSSGNASYTVTLKASGTVKTTSWDTNMHQNQANNVNPDDATVNSPLSTVPRTIQKSDHQDTEQYSTDSSVENSREGIISDGTSTIDYKSENPTTTGSNSSLPVIDSDETSSTPGELQDDAQNTTQNDTISALVDTTSPEVSIKPLFKGEASGVVEIQVVVLDDSEIKQVQLFVNDLFLGNIPKDENRAVYIYKWDTSTLSDGVYILRAKAYDAAGNEGTSEDLTITVNNPPALPKSLTIAYVRVDKVILKWAANPEQNANGYNLYRAPSPKGPYKKINQETLTTPYFEDIGLVAGTTYYYKITYLNEFGKEVANTYPVISIVGGKTENILNWNTNSEQDLAGYNVYRSTSSGSKYEKINLQPLQANTLKDDQASTGVTYSYIVTAVDRLGNESKF